MPTYTFKTTEGQEVTRRLTIAQFEQVREGLLELQDEDGSVLELLFRPGNTAMVMKDGPSGGWASKAMKENKYRKAHNRVMDQRQRDHVRKTKLIPNLNGVEASNWREVQDEVRTQKGAEAAATYEPLVAKESKGTT
jgi:hypothetical protein